MNEKDKIVEQVIVMDSPRRHTSHDDQQKHGSLRGASTFERICQSNCPSKKLKALITHLFLSLSSTNGDTKGAVAAKRRRACAFRGWLGDRATLKFSFEDRRSGRQRTHSTPPCSILSDPTPVFYSSLYFCHSTVQGGRYKYLELARSSKESYL